MTERPQRIAFSEMRDGRAWSCGNRSADVRPDFHSDKARPAGERLLIGAVAFIKCLVPDKLATFVTLI